VSLTRTDPLQHSYIRYRPTAAKSGVNIADYGRRPSSSNNPNFIARPSEERPQKLRRFLQEEARTTEQTARATPESEVAA